MGPSGMARSKLRWRWGARFTSRPAPSELAALGSTRTPKLRRQPAARSPNRLLWLPFCKLPRARRGWECRPRPEGATSTLACILPRSPTARRHRPRASPACSQATSLQRQRFLSFESRCVSIAWRSAAELRTMARYSRSAFSPRMKRRRVSTKCPMGRPNGASNAGAQAGPSGDDPWKA